MAKKLNTDLAGFGSAGRGSDPDLNANTGIKDDSKSSSLTVEQLTYDHGKTINNPQVEAVEALMDGTQEAFLIWRALTI